MKRQVTQLAAVRYRAWQELLDFSAELSLSGLRAQGLSFSEAWRQWRRRWAKASLERHKANRHIAQKLSLRDSST